MPDSEPTERTSDSPIPQHTTTPARRRTVLQPAALPPGSVPHTKQLLRLHLLRLFFSRSNMQFTPNSSHEHQSLRCTCRRPSCLLLPDMLVPPLPAHTRLKGKPAANKKPTPVQHLNHTADHRNVISLFLVRVGNLQYKQRNSASISKVSRDMAHCCDLQCQRALELPKIQSPYLISFEISKF